MIKTTLLLSSLFVLTINAQANCLPIQFESVESTTTKKNGTDNWISVRLASTASLRLPVQTFEWISTSLDGSLIFSNSDKTFSGIIAYETPEVIHFYQENTSPYDFYQNIFLSPKGNYCDYLNAYKLDDKKYRHQLLLKEGVVFAFGDDRENRFYILNKNKPDIVISGTIRSNNTQEINQILKSIQLTN